MGMIQRNLLSGEYLKSYEVFFTDHCPGRGNVSQICIHSTALPLINKVIKYLYAGLSVDMDKKPYAEAGMFL